MHVLILTEGKGGDFQGAAIIKEILKEKGLDVQLHRVSEYKPESEEFYVFGEDLIAYDMPMRTKFKEICIVGQDAVSAIVSDKEKLLSEIEFERITIYAHLLNKKIVNQLEEKYGSRLEFFTTAASKKAFVDFKGKVTFGSAIKTQKIDKSQIGISYSTLKDIFNFELPTIHLGGRYKNSDGEWVNISNDDYAVALQKLPIGDAKEISVILHPRAFSGLDDVNQIMRLSNIHLSLLEAFEKLEKINFFAGKSTLNLLPKEISGEIKPIELNYALFLHALWFLSEGGMLKKIGPQFVSADQYNAFSDIPCAKEAFTLAPEDKEQASYVESLNSECPDLTALITDFFSSKKKSFVESLGRGAKSPEKSFIKSLEDEEKYYTPSPGKDY